MPAIQKNGLPLILLLAAATASGAQARAVEIIAHRGASGNAPENTLAAVKLAWKEKADAVEIDIHLSRDGELVVIHDATTLRTAGIDRRIDQLSLAEIRQLDAGKWKDARFTGEKIPTLDQVIAALPKGRRLFIEIKSGPETVPVLKRCLSHWRKKRKQFVIIGFALGTMAAAKKEMPDIEAYWLHSMALNKENGTILLDAHGLSELAKTAAVDGVDLKAVPALDAAFVKEVHAAGLKCFVYTVDSGEEARRLKDIGVDGITTNYPARLREQADIR